MTKAFGLGVGSPRSNGLARLAGRWSSEECREFDWFHQIHVHLVSAAPNGLFVEYFPDDTVFNFGWLVDHELEVRDGALVLPERPGPGVEFVEEAVGRFALAI
jgi:L-alanine-DL-glutamate epimerase-like enolase superfamily enzyme